MNNYYENLLSQYVPNKVVVPDSILELKDARLRITEVPANSDKGILIIPGFTVPRESYFTLLPEFLDFNILIYDPRGHSNSEGEISASAYINDINEIGRRFKSRHNLKFLIGLSHSMGSLCLLAASCRQDHPFDKRIALAPVIKADLVMPNLPNNFVSVLFAYIYNFHRKLTQRAFSDEIVLHHQHSNLYDFIKDPSIVALKLKEFKKLNGAKEFPFLTELVHCIPDKTYVIFAGDDQRLGIRNNKLEGVYATFAEKAIAHKIRIEVLADLSHRFNRQPETQFRFSYNNTLLIKMIRKIIDKEA
jgi:pimeloyl-ACP methyl ester carboxylesterase